MKETLIILGAGVMQGPAIKIAKELGLYTIALDGSSCAPCISMADRFEKIDLKDKEGIEAFARSIQSTIDRLGIMTAGTDFSASVAWTAEKLGLPGIPYEAALNASDKSRMRECFKKANLPSPDFITITEKNLTEFKQNNELNKNPVELCSLLTDNCSLSFPLVIKPVDNMGGRGCRRINTIGEFYEAAKTAIGFSRSGRAIVESYMDGPEFSVDAIVYKGEITICGLADRHIFFPPYFIEMGHTMPTIIEKEKQEAMLDTFRAGIHALGLDGANNVGAAKGDIKLTSKGAAYSPMIGEIAARLSGGYMSGWTYPYSSGASPIKAAILIAMGREPEELIPARNWTCAERAFISIPGTVKQITGSSEQGAENKELSNYVNDLFMRITEGDKVSFPENNVTKCGNIIASAPDRQTAIAAAENTAKSILIRLDPNDRETEKFLAETQSNAENEKFPPDAFILTNEIREALVLIPESKEDSATNKHEQTRTEEISKSSCGSWSKFCIHPFPAFESSNLTDYMGRTVKETLDAVRKLTGFPLPIIKDKNPCAANSKFEAPMRESLLDPPKNAENSICLGRSFWAALIRGSYQGAVYYMDNLGENDKNRDI
ncbi:MAG: ATP-grasp domain-containing protein [Treponema sp.]|nr:ATP-grasp domain-containing protein [Treponema sp.]